MSPEIVALLVLLGGVVAAVVFTLAVVFMVDRSAGNTRSPNQDGKERGRESEER